MEAPAGHFLNRSLNQKRKGRIKMATQHNLRMTAIVVCGLGASLAVATPSAIAQEQPVVIQGEPQEVRIEHVKFADLDLSSARDAKRLSARVGGAVERVCEIDLGRDGLQDKGYYRCAGLAWSDAQEQIGKAVMAAQLASLDDAPAAVTTAIAVRAISR